MANYATLKAAINAVIKANGNKEITGTVLNETLTAMVNSLGANYQFAGVATPSTNPGTPDQNVFYLAGKAGTYTNFNSIVLPNGVSILKWNGSWSSETVAAGDGVFDISAYKETGGTLATFADLSAALDGGNNIPSALRKGGMSVKFVQSSDKKYVQYRYIGMEVTGTPNPFLDTENWSFCEENVLVKHPEFAEVKTDSSSKILEGFKPDGTKYIAGNLQVEGDITNPTVSGNFYLQNETILPISSPEYIKATIDNHGKLLDSIEKDGSHYMYNLKSESIDILKQNLKKYNIIIDTDWGGDPDDAMALRVFSYYHLLGKVNLVGIAYIYGEAESGVQGLDAQMLFDGVSGMEIISRNSVEQGAAPGNYTQAAAAFPHTKSQADGTGVSAYRQLLSNQKTKCRIVVTGPLTYLSDLVDSAADNISALNGIQLIKEKVDRVYIMGGQFKNSEEYMGEYNFVKYPAATQNFFAKCPVPIYISGFENAENIDCGINTDQELPNYDIFRKEMEACLGVWSDIMETGRQAHDPLLMLCACSDEPIDAGFNVTRGNVDFNWRAQTKFVSNEGGNTYKMSIMYNTSFYKDKINKIIFKNIW